MDVSAGALGLRPTEITLVSAPACHFCAEARQVLAELATQFPVSVEIIEFGDPRGDALVREHRAALYPLVLVDGAFFSAGRLPRRKLGKLLETRPAPAVS